MLDPMFGVILKVESAFMAGVRVSVWQARSAVHRKMVMAASFIGLKYKKDVHSFSFLTRSI